MQAATEGWSQIARAREARANRADTVMKTFIIGVRLEQQTNKPKDQRYTCREREKRLLEVGAPQVCFIDLRVRLSGLMEWSHSSQSWDSHQMIIA